MTRRALVHTPSPHLAQCELTYLDRAPIDMDRARAEHAAYCRTLADLGVEVTVLDGNAAYPDSVFVEDTAVILDEMAIVTPLGTPSRRGEAAFMADALTAWRQVIPLPEDVRLEGGDVLRVGRTLFVGQGARTDRAGCMALDAIVRPAGYAVVPVPVSRCLHLKTGVTALDDGTLLLNPEWIDPASFPGFDWMAVDPSEPFAANTLRIGTTIVMPAEFPRTRALVEARGYTVTAVGVSEFLKAEAGLTCMSLLFHDA